jgi:hypothetical protein
MGVKLGFSPGYRAEREVVVYVKCFGVKGMIGDYKAENWKWMSSTVRTF